ncbi:NAD(P)H nitroreductase [Xanthobacter sp. V4C-4]|uniref:NAD(P)H nitroreductase n=1 Tax=Xanthobacter cornucopiae TaxID=3119924 RepID=UPI00372A04F0
MDALTLLLNRRSTAALAAPAPAGAALEAILNAALRVPDFQGLRPYEFLIAEGEGRARLGRLMRAAAVASGRPEADVIRAPEMPLRAPLVIVVIAKARESRIVSVFEQQLTAGCAVMAMQMAAVAQGFSGLWRSGWPMFDPHLARALGLEAADRIVGFLYLGTPTCPPVALVPVESQAFVRHL